MNGNEEVLVLKLRTGEEILGLVSKDSSYVQEHMVYYVKHPLLMVMTPNGQLGSIPWMAYTDIGETGIPIKMGDVLFEANPKPDLKENYLAALSPIATPTKKIVLAG